MVRNIDVPVIRMFDRAMTLNRIKIEAPMRNTVLVWVILDKLKTQIKV